MPEGGLTYQKLWEKAEELLRETKSINKDRDLVTLAQNLETNMNELKNLLNNVLGKIKGTGAGDIILSIAKCCPSSPQKVLEAALNPSNLASTGTSGPCDYVEFMDLLKKTVKTYNKNKEEFCKNKYKNNNQRQECAKKVKALVSSPLLDTCYDGKRAERLQKGLDALKNIGGCGLVALLLASYAAMLKGGDDVFERVEWVLLLLRAVARKEDKDAYISVCPGKGDVAAVAYYLLLCCGGGGGGQGGA